MGNANSAGAAHGPAVRMLPVVDFWMKFAPGCVRVQLLLQEGSLRTCTLFTCTSNDGGHNCKKGFGAVSSKGPWAGT